jgi:hypothetical protein
MKAEGPELGRKVQPDISQSAAIKGKQCMQRQLKRATNGRKVSCFKRIWSESSGGPIDKLPPLVDAPWQDHPLDNMWVGCDLQAKEAVMMVELRRGARLDRATG